METGKMLFLTRSDVAKCEISLDRSLEISEKTYSEHAKGHYEMPPKPGVHPESCPGAFLHAMPARLPETKNVGIKWIGVFQHNPEKYKMPSASGIIVLNDYDSGYPVAIMEGGLVTAIRTANASGVSAKYLAKKNAKTLGIVGTGEQGRGTVLSVCRTVPTIEEVKIYDLYPNMMQRLIDECGPKISAKITICKNAEEVIRDTDIIATAAPLTVKEPVYKEEWIKEGALVLPVHCNGYSIDFFKSHKLVVDDWNQYHNYMFGPTKYYTEDIAAPYAQLGEIINGVKPGRENDKEIIIDANLGIALQDIALAQEVYKIAQEKGLGQELSLL